MSSPQHVCRRFHTVAQQGAERVALSYFDGGRWQHCSYRQLEDRAKAIARQLLAAGIGRGMPVGVYTPRHPDSIAAMIAVMDLGVYFVPVDPQDPEARRRSLLRAAEATVVVRPSGSVDSAPIAIDVSADLAAAGVTEQVGRRFPVAAQPSAEDIAYVMFTSGSTGRPKGVVVPHRGITRLVTGQDYLRFDADQVFLQAAPMNFDASTLEIWGALLHGARCVLYPVGAVPTAGGIREVVASEGVTTAWLTASLFHAIVDRDVASLSGLQQLIVGGEVLSPVHVGKALDALPDTQLVNGYGPTENTTFTTCYRIPANVARGHPIPIGRAIQGTQLAVVDDALRPLAPGTEGELVAIGEGLALGYLGDPALTEERFVELKGGDGQIRRGYRTGDRVVERPDGVLEFVGRADAQVKIDGYRIEPGEIESVVAGLPEVAQCRVIAAHDPVGRLRLIAYVVLRTDQGDETWKQGMVAALPSYLIPHHVVPLAALPMGASGKLARERLPMPWTTPPKRRGGVRARHLDAVLRSWAEVLATEPASPDVNFFDAGGRSLDAMRLQELLERDTGLALEPTFVFEFTTPLRQAEALEDLVSRSAAVARGAPAASGAKKR